MRTMRSVSLLAVALLVWLVVAVAAADEWIEVKSAHFTVVSNASERSARKLVWQPEQVRSATAAYWRRALNWQSSSCQAERRPIWPAGASS